VRKKASEGRTFDLSIKRHLVAPFAGLLEGGVEESLGAFARDPQTVDHFLVIGMNGSLARPEHPLGVLANDQHVDPAGPVALQRRVVGVVEMDGPQPGIELEPLAQVELRRNLHAGCQPHVGQTHRAEQHGVVERMRSKASSDICSPVSR
jgi:hypothetical protein